MRILFVRHYILAAAAMALLLSSAVEAQEEVVVKADSVRKYRFLGKTSRDKKDHQAVVDYYTELLKYQEPDRRTLYYIGRAHLALGAQAGAKVAFLEAAALDSAHANTALSLYQIFSSESKPDSGWVFLKRLLEKKPNDTRLLGFRRALGDQHRRRANAEAALFHYEELADHRAIAAELRAELTELIAVIYSDLGDAEAALAWRQRLLGETGTHQIETLRKMVDLQLETGDFDAAFATLRELTISDSAGRYSHYLRLAELGERRGDEDIRLVGLEGMAQVQPDDLENVATLVQFHIQAGDTDAAMQWIGKGLGRQPGHAHLLILRGDLLREAGKAEDAVASFESALADPNWEAVAQQRIWQIHPPETEEEKLRRQFFGSDSSGDDDRSETRDSSGGQAESETLPYRLVEEKDISYPGVSRRTYRLVFDVDTVPTPEQMRMTMVAFWKEGRTGHDEVTIWGYLPEMDVQNLAYAIAEFPKDTSPDFMVIDGAAYNTRWWDEVAKADGDEVRPMTAEPAEYQGRLSLERDGSTVRLRFQSDLPTGTTALVSAERLFRERKGEDEYSGEIFSEDVALHDGKLDLHIKVSDATWHKRRLKQEKQFADAGIFGTIGGISDDVVFSVMVSPRRQTERIMAAFGRDGEKMAGPHIRVSGVRVFEIKDSLRIAFDPD